MLKVAEVIRNDKDLNSRSFQVAGHTDNKPLAGGPFKDNWGLSVMRSREVLSFLIAPSAEPPAAPGAKVTPGGGGLPRDHWSAAGYGDTDPVAANDTPENTQKNRRVELVVLPNVEEMLDLKSLTQIAIARRRDRHRHQHRPLARRRHGGARGPGADRRAM